MTIEPYIKNDKIYFIKKSPEELTEHFQMRCNFIASQKPTTQAIFDECVVYSRIYINNKIYSTLYNEQVMNKLEEMTKKIYE